MIATTIVEITLARRVSAIPRAAFLEMVFYLNGSPHILAGY